MPERAILAVAYTPVSVSGGVRRSVGGFLRYIHYRDRDRSAEAPDQRVDAEIRYVAHRDRAASRGRLFDRDGRIGDEERRSLTDFVSRASRTTKPQLTRDRDGQLRDRRRALYRMVLSPERAQGLDLQRLARETVAQLERDLGAEVRWLGAEHRNTAHPHVHLVVAGFRETSPGRFRGVVITRERLQRMKDALAREIERQREQERTRQTEREHDSGSDLRAELEGLTTTAAATGSDPVATPAPAFEARRGASARPPESESLLRREGTHRPPRRRSEQSRRRGLPPRRRQPWTLDRELDRIAESYRRQAERLARERSWEREERD